ncbi:MAG: 4Fe-4S dicluster domain-containing protein [Ignavibacteria bacterium]|nr:4Fe-4S dicluster domain-containing protein [Ignavibacteria bacterium]
MERRDFLSRLLWSSFFLFSSCRRPDLIFTSKVKQDYFPPFENVANYSTTFPWSGFPVGINVKTINDAPFWISGNPFHPFSKGALAAPILASLYNLYDPLRFNHPRIGDKKFNLSEVLSHTFESLLETIKKGQKVLVFCEYLHSPTIWKLQLDLQNSFENLAIYNLPTFDFCSNQISANRMIFDEKFYILKDIHETKIIVNFERDFLFNDLFFPFYANKFNPKKHKIYTFESIVSLTGMNSNRRYILSNYEIERVAFNLLTLLSKEFVNSGSAFVELDDISLRENELISQELIDEILRNRGNVVFLCSDFASPTLHLICYLLDYITNGNTFTLNYHKIDLSEKSNFLEKFDSSLLKTQNIGKVVFLNYNPYFSLNSPLSEFIEDYPKENVVSSSLYANKLVEHSGCYFPAKHYLEFWLDYANFDGSISAQQQIIFPLNSNSISTPEFLFCLKDYLSKRKFNLEEYKSFIFKRYSESFDSVELRENLSEGFFSKGSDQCPHPNLGRVQLRTSIEFIKQSLSQQRLQSKEILIIPHQYSYAGEYSYNIYLNEIPEPISSATWGIPLFTSLDLFGKMELLDGETYCLKFSDLKELVFPIVSLENSKANYFFYYDNYYIHKNFDFDYLDLVDLVRKQNYYYLDISNVRFERLLGRKIHLAKFSRNNFSDIKLEEILGTTGYDESKSINKNRILQDRKWVMSVDVQKCIGCNLCMVACQIENNIPIVGIEFISKERDMFWIGIQKFAEPKYGKEVIFLPIMCQHCDFAPCESVCPVGATSHIQEGINEMTYSRCVGSRFCMVNCPYKVRKFNFISSTEAHLNFLPRMSNPFVTIRSRGVSEKCTFCIHRINFAKSLSKLKGNEEYEYDVKTACQEACPVSALFFGRKEKILTSHKNSEVKYLLPKLNTSPNILYFLNVSDE